ncbi:hypothetical protein LCGC14_2215190 [marine sediment metagenome]|uniref:Uncharacterized protein n=1 Tax=marine sediment metagenome TaxID=412755 RepID=A0A0F9E033_9ZZZZ
MKKILIVLIVLVLSTSICFAVGQSEDVMTLTWVASGKPMAFPEWEDSEGYAGVQEKIAAQFEKENPGVKVIVLYRDVTQGSLTVDAMMAKGEPPDVWLDAQDYFLKYLNDDYALRLEEYMDTSIYFDHLIDLFTKDGHVYALPENNVAGGFAINLDMLDQIGYTMPAQEDWTTDEFLRLSAKLKAAGIPSTMIITQNGISAWNFPWLYAFGAEMYRNGDYSKVTINSPEAVEGLNYMKKLVDLGYAYPHPNELNEDAAVELFTSGQVFSSMMQNGHTDYWLPQQVAQGVIEKEFNLTFVEAPHAPGREHTPVFGYQTIAVGHKSDDEERNKMIAKLTAAAASMDMQYYVCVVAGGFPTIKGFEPDEGNAAKASYKAIRKLSSIAGQMDLGDLSQHSTELYRPWKLLMHAFMDGKITAEEVLSQYEAEAIKIIGAK